AAGGVAAGAGGAKMTARPRGMRTTTAVRTRRMKTSSIPYDAAGGRRDGSGIHPRRDQGHTRGQGSGQDTPRSGTVTLQLPLQKHSKRGLKNVTTAADPIRFRQGLLRLLASDSPHDEKLLAYV